MPEPSHRAIQRAFVVGIVGAESTGKTVLAQALAERLRAEGHAVAWVDEALRRFCDETRRTPRVDEQRDIARRQTQAIDRAATDHDIVVADTTALMTAVYSDIVFGDTSLYDEALADHGRVDLSLLTALDLPWVPDGHQRDGPHVREPVDTLVRSALRRAGCDHAVVAGQGEHRVAAAMASVRRALQRRAAPVSTATRWRWQCDRCGDADCERHWLPSAVHRPDAPNA